MACEVKIVADSISGAAKRITTFQLKYWRAIHAEAKTHRQVSKNGEEYETIILTQDDSLMSDPNLSRNASSSRAIPVQKMIDQVRNDPAGPVFWGANQAGMQARTELGEREIQHAKLQWLRAAEDMCKRAENLMAIGAHKQIINRLLEPFQYIHVVVTATEWQNFFDLRCHPDAMPEIQELAYAMFHAMEASFPILRNPSIMYQRDIDTWHLPYITEEERNLPELKVDPNVAAAVSAARCARVSYLKHDGTTPSFHDDLDLYNRLVGSKPLHASPCEHQARALHNPEYASGNFFGWAQFRKKVEKHEFSVSTYKE